MQIEIPVQYWNQRLPLDLKGWVGGIPVEFQLWMHLGPIRDGDPFIKMIRIAPEYEWEEWEESRKGADSETVQG